MHFNQPTNFGLCFCRKEEKERGKLFSFFELKFCFVKKIYTIVNCSFSMGATLNLTDENILKLRLKLLFLYLFIFWGVCFVSSIKICI